jgi:curved DNA-binding protein CbpA
VDYYEELGISRNATDEEIRIAYRRKAKAVHPDKGGDPEAMRDTNRAYETLIEPARRLTYDRTGQDKPPPPIDKRAQEMVTANIMAWIDADQTSGNLTADLSMHFDNEHIKAQTEIIQRSASLSKIEKRLTKLKFRGKGQDFVRLAMERKVIGMRQQIEQLRDKSALIERAKAMLLEIYDYEMDPPAPVTVYTFMSQPG